MKKEFVRNPYNYDSDDLSDATGLHCPEPTRTEQEHIEEADINYIADRFMRTGEMPTLLAMPKAGDFEGIFDFQSAMNTIANAKQEFMRLPAKIRTRFGNDPAQLIEFIEDRDNYDEAVRLGFIEKPADYKEPDNGTSTQGRTEKAPDGRKGTARTETTQATDAGTEKPGRQAPKGGGGGDN